MSGKYINNNSYANDGYILTGAYNSVTIGPNGLVGGIISRTNEPYTIVNTGTIEGPLGGTFGSGASFGIALPDGGTVTNDVGALIEGLQNPGVAIGGDSGTVANSGRIVGSGPRFNLKGAYAGVVLSGGGTVINAPGAAIYGRLGVYILGGSGSVTNSGIIDGDGVGLDDAGGILLGAGGAVINNAGAQIFEDVDIQGGDGSVNNNGTIHAGILLGEGGAVINGAAAYSDGIAIQNGSGTITNEGIIGNSCKLYDGGLLTNGTGAAVDGDVSVSGAAGTITNAGRITSYFGVAVFLHDGGAVTNTGSGAIIEAAGDGVAVSLVSGSELFNSGGTILAAGIRSTGIALANDSLAAFGMIEATGSGGVGIVVGASGTVSNAAIVEATGSDGIGVRLTATGSVTNAALIEATGPGGIGVDVVAMGIVSNAAHQAVTGYAIGIKLQSRGTLGNTGTVKATGKFGIAVDLIGGGHVTNIGGGLIEASASDAKGIELGAGCTVVNGIGGTILGNDGGIETGIGSFSDTITNNGKIEGTGGLDAEGVLLEVGGLVANGVGALITGGTGIEAGDGHTKITNAGTIRASTGDGITLAGQGFVTDSGGGLISGRYAGIAFASSGSTLISTGTITGGTYGVTIAGGGLVTNGKNGLIEGAIGVATSSGTIANGGTIEGLGGYAGIYLDTGLITNVAGGMIAGTNGIEAISRTTISNAGTIKANDGVAIYLDRGTVTNTGTASLIEGNEGVALVGQGTVVNFGTIASSSGPDGAAVLFQSGLDVLVDEAGSHIVGRVTGGGGTIELVGNGGTLSGFGTQFRGFSYIDVIEGASWVFGGNDAIGSDILNNGTLADLSGLIALSGDVSGTGRVTIGATGTLDLEGSVTATETIAFAGTTGGTLLLDDPSGSGLGFAGAVSGFGGTDRLDLASFAFSGGAKLAWAQSGAKGTLTVTDGSEVAKITLFGQYAAAGFKAAKDTAGGTVVTYTTPPAAVTLASPHH